MGEGDGVGGVVGAHPEGGGGLFAAGEAVADE